MPTEMLTRNGAMVAPPVATSTTEDELHAWARKHLERVRRLKVHVVTFLFAMLVLTPAWLLIEWQDNGGFERWSNNSQPGDWEPWILYIAGIWLIVLAVEGLRVYFDRPTTEAEIDREVERLRSRG